MKKLVLGFLAIIFSAYAEVKIQRQPFLKALGHYSSPPVAAPRAGGTTNALPPPPSLLFSEKISITPKTGVLTSFSFVYRSSLPSATCTFARCQDLTPKAGKTLRIVLVFSPFNGAIFESQPYQLSLELDLEDGVSTYYLGASEEFPQGGYIKIAASEVQLRLAITNAAFAGWVPLNTLSAMAPAPMNTASLVSGSYGSLGVFDAGAFYPAGEISIDVKGPSSDYLGSYFYIGGTTKIKAAKGGAGGTAEMKSQAGTWID
jgi:hypothetical protein